MQAYLHFARAVAFAGLGKVDEAQKEREQLQQLQKQIKPSEEYANNPFVKILEVADVMAEAALAKAQKASDKYIAALKKGMALQEMLDYDEPPPWCVQIRQQLGFALLEKKDFKGAEQEFKVCLQKMRRNGRSLFGLTQALKGQERSVDAYWVEREMRNAVAEWGEGVKGLERLLSLSEF